MEYFIDGSYDLLLISLKDEKMMKDKNG